MHLLYVRQYIYEYLAILWTFVSVSIQVHLGDKYNFQIVHFF